MKKVIQVRLDKKDIEKLKRQAEKTGHTVSSFMRLKIREILKTGGENVRE